MADSRPASPDAPPEDLWSSILDSVSSSRIIPAKQILILGEPASGKSTLAAAILSKSSSQEGAQDEELDFALGYDWVDVRDEGDEGESLFHKEMNIFLFCVLCSTMILIYAFLEFRHPRTTVSLHRAVFCAHIQRVVTALLTPTIGSATYRRHHCS